jgi:hypothetical protein
LSNIAVRVHGPILLGLWFMKNINVSSATNKTNSHIATSWTDESLATIRTTARDYANPVDYQHPYPSMARFGFV